MSKTYPDICGLTELEIDEDVFQEIGQNTSCRKTMPMHFKGFMAVRLISIGQDLLESLSKGFVEDALIQRFKACHPATS